MRYTVNDVKDDPAGDPPRKLLGVAWMTYAFTGCSGAISTAATAVSVTWGAVLPDLGGTSLTAPIRHGPFQLVPENWTGAVGTTEVHEAPVLDNPSYTEVLAEARLLPYWRDPALPAGWTFCRAIADPTELTYGYSAVYLTPRGNPGLLIQGAFTGNRGGAREAAWRPNGADLGVRETRVIAGRPAQVIYSPPGPGNFSFFPVSVWVFAAAAESVHVLHGYTKSLRGSNVDAVIAIARSLFAPPNAP